MTELNTIINRDEFPNWFSKNFRDIKKPNDIEALYDSSIYIQVSQIHFSFSDYRVDDNEPRWKDLTISQQNKILGCINILLETNLKFANKD